MRKIIIAVALILFGFLSACEKNIPAPGSEFLGRWVNTHDNKFGSEVDYEIARNGAEYILSSYMDNYKKKITMVPLQYQSGSPAHLVGSVDALTPINVVINKETGKLLFRGREFTHAPTPD